MATSPQSPFPFEANRISSVDWVTRDDDNTIDQEKLDELARLHERFVDGLPGGRRLNIALKLAEDLNFSKYRLMEAELRGTRLARGRFQYANLTKANLFGADLRQSDLRRCDLTKADMRGAILRGSNLELARMQSTDARQGFLMERADAGEINRLNKGGEGLPGASMRGADLSGARLSGDMVASTDLSNANLKNSHLKGADLSGCVLRGVLFEGADLTGANLSGSILHGAVLSGAILTDVNLEDADLNAAIFDSATFANCDVSQAKLPRSMAELDRSVREILEGHYAWILSLGSQGMRANLSGFDLTRQSFQRCELSAAEFSQSLLIETDMTRANLSMAQFVSVNGMDARFAASTIRGANLSNAVMTRADFRDVDAGAMKISGARDFEWPTNFTGTVLDDANLQGINMCGAKATGLSVRKANLRGANLRRADLTGADLTGADLTGADLAEAVLVDVVR